MFVFKVEEHDSFYFGTILKPSVDLALKSSIGYLVLKIWVSGNGAVHNE